MKRGFIPACLFVLAAVMALGGAQDVDGTTALHWAVRLDNIGLVRALLAKGAKVGAANRYGVTPLELAAVNGSTPMVELLLGARGQSERSGRGLRGDRTHVGCR